MIFCINFNSVFLVTTIAISVPTLSLCVCCHFVGHVVKILARVFMLLVSTCPPVLTTSVSILFLHWYILLFWNFCLLLLCCLEVVIHPNTLICAFSSETSDASIKSLLLLSNLRLLCLYYMRINVLLNFLDWCNFTVPWWLRQK